jgi:hypothetical protein
VLGTNTLKTKVLDATPLFKRVFSANTLEVQDRPSLEKFFSYFVFRCTSKGVAAFSSMGVRTDTLKNRGICNNAIIANVVFLGCE